jgi:hypothetical protein
MIATMNYVDKLVIQSHENLMLKLGESLPLHVSWNVVT